MRKFLFIDDLRSPPDNVNWDVVRSSDEAKHYVMCNGCPEMISFDHDLGLNDTTMVFLHWLIDEDIQQHQKLIPEKFEYVIHSANPPGRENLESLLKSYLLYRKTK
jgi:hypothetical protein